MPGVNDLRQLHMTKKRIVPLLLALTGALCYVSFTLADPRAFNGTWTLNATDSQTFEVAGEELNKALLRELRLERTYEMDGRPSKSSSKHVGKSSHDQSIELLRHDERPVPWEAADELAQMLEAESIKLYYARKFAILYGAERKRLLTVNLAGRSFSVKGTTVTKDDIGTSLAYLEDGAIVIETDTRWHDKLVERFELNETSDHLRVTIRMQQVILGSWLEYVRTFDRTD